jgi:uncharacterized protein (DUF885 family)
MAGERTDLRIGDHLRHHVRMREQQGDDPVTTARFREVADKVLDALLEAAPEESTELGDHRFDDQLTDYSPASVADRAVTLADALGALDDVDDTGLLPDDRVDLEILRTQVTGTQWELTELRRYENDPLLHLPGAALHPLIARSSPDPAERLRSLASRLRLVPERLATAREVLHDMPQVHVETAVARTEGIRSLLVSEELTALIGDDVLSTKVRSAASEADAALREHQAWLEAQLPVSDGDPRLGEQSFAARLWYTLDTETGPDALLTRAESDLQAVEEEISEVASSMASSAPRPGLVREMLDRVARSAPVTDSTILSLCSSALSLLDARVRELDLMTVPEAPVSIIVMPEAQRGIGVATCEPPGPLEPSVADRPTFFAVSPTPASWSAARVESFYREYNGHMLRNLTVHEAMPGHVLQLAHSARYRGATRVRLANMSGPFVEGWATFAEALMAAAGLGLTASDDAALRLMQLKMQMRTLINAVLDVRVHAHGMTEAEAMRLMTERGHQEEGEAAGKWRRALLTSAQLSTYYVGYRELTDISSSLALAHPSWAPKQVHDEILAHGSPPPRHLRTLLGLE